MSLTGLVRAKCKHRNLVTGTRCDELPTSKSCRSGFSEVTP